MSRGAPLAVFASLAVGCSADGRSVVSAPRPAPDAAPAVDAAPPADVAEPPQGAPLEPISSASGCSLLNVALLPSPAPLTDPRRMTLRLGLGRSVRGPESSQGASLFNVNAMPGERCALRVLGPCVVRDCRPVLTHVGDRGAPLLGVLAGLVTIRGSGMQGPYVLGSGENGIYATAPMGAVRAEPPWRADDVACVTADGFGLVPSFRARVTVPPTVRVLEPTLADPVADVLVVRRGAGLTVRWEPLAEEVTVSMGQRPSNGQITTWLEDLSMVCTYDGMAGRAEVSPEALAGFQTLAEGNSSGGLSVNARREVAMTAGPVRVILGATQGVSLRARFE